MFHDCTLMKLAARRSLYREELATIGGVGAAKLERYGEELLALFTNQ